MKTERVRIGATAIALTHNGIQRDRITLLLLHGLGDSARAFDEAFGDPRFAAFNLLAPDMPGYGESAAAVTPPISLDAYVKLLADLLTQHGTTAAVVVAHSMGGAIGTLLCAADDRRMIRGLVNIEGNLLTADQFISGKAAAAAEAGDFTRWFHDDFCERMVRRKWVPGNPSCRRYYESLLRCTPEAFRDHSRELIRRSGGEPAGPWGEIAQAYLKLQIPKLFCLGAANLPQETLAFLQRHGEPHKIFPGASHTVMIDVPQAFYTSLYDFIRTVASAD